MSKNGPMYEVQSGNFLLTTVGQIPFFKTLSGRWDWSISRREQTWNLRRLKKPMQEVWLYCDI